MRITIYASDINITPDINDYLEKKLSSLDRLASRVRRGAKESGPAPMEIRVKIEREATRNEIYRVGAEVVLSRRVISVDTKNQDIFQAIDELKDKLQGEMRRYGGRREAIYRRARRAIKRMRLWPGEESKGGRERQE